MFVRLIAVLLAVGMLVITTQALDLATPDTTAIIDDVDDVPPIAVIETAAMVPDRPVAESQLPAPDVLEGQRPEIMIFRPPRVAAFV